jgi:hypothetical protein
MNVMFANKDFLIQVVLLNMKEHTLETNPMNVMFATRDICGQAT